MRFLTWHRREVLGAAITATVVLSFAAGAVAMRNDSTTPEVNVETIGAAQPETTTVAPTTSTTTTTTTTPTTTLPPTTTTVAPPPPTTAKPVPPPPPVTNLFTFEAPGAGTMTVKLEGNVLTVTATNAYAGWTAEVHTATSSEYVKTIFRQGNVVKYVKAFLKKGTVTPETGGWTECSGTPAPTTATYAYDGVGAITVTWNGTAFTLDATTPADGWSVVDQETPGDYVRVYFAPVVTEVQPQTDGNHEHDDHRWIKVKIHDCQIAHVTGP